jgi:hypothetical protein
MRTKISAHKDDELEAEKDGVAYPMNNTVIFPLSLNKLSFLLFTTSPIHDYPNHAQQPILRLSWITLSVHAVPFEIQSCGHE